MYKEHGKMKKLFQTYAGVIVLYIVFAIIQIVVIASKQNYYVDEIFSYGSANYTESCSMQPRPAPYTYSPAGEAYYEYMTVDEDAGLNVDVVWKNQAADVHPPLYYLFVHILSCLYKGRYTKWIAGVINIVFMLMTLCGVRQIAGLMENDSKITMAISLFFIMSAEVLSSVSFFRMYIITMCEVIWLTYLLLRYYQRETIWFYLMTGIVSVCGALTHYYFLIYLFWASVIYCIGLLTSKKIKRALLYICTMAASGAAAVLIFPQMIYHMFGGGYRGTESFQNLHKGMRQYATNLKAFFSIINDRLFGGMILILLIMLLFAGILYLQKSKWKLYLQKFRDNWEWAILLGPALLYFLLVSKIAVYNVDRYMMPVYAVLVVGVLLVITRLLRRVFGNHERNTKIVLILILSIMLIGSWKNCKWPYLYLETKQTVDAIKEYSALDCLCICKKGDEWKTYGNFVELCKLNSITFFPDGLEPLQSMNELNGKSQYLLYIYGADDEEILTELQDICPQITGYEKLDGIGYASVYHVYGWNETM